MEWQGSDMNIYIHGNINIQKVTNRNGSEVYKLVVQFFQKDTVVNSWCKSNKQIAMEELLLSTVINFILSFHYFQNLFFQT